MHEVIWIGKAPEFESIGVSFIDFKKPQRHQFLLGLLTISPIEGCHGHFEQFRSEDQASPPIGIHLTLLPNANFGVMGSKAKPD